MGMRRQSDPHGNRLPADLVEGVGESLELIVARTTGRTLAHVDFPMVASERLEKITGEGHMIGNGLGDLVRIDEIRRLADLAIGRVDECDAGIIEYLFELHRMFPILLNAIRVRLDALQSQGGDPFDRPHRVVLLAPDGAGGPEKNVWIDGVERLMRTAPHTLAGLTTLAAAVMPDNARAEDINSRLLSPRSATLADMGTSFLKSCLFCSQRS